VPRRRGLGLSLLLLGLVAAPAGAAATATSTPAPPTIVLHGKGFGHGVGLAQDGDLALGREGRTASQILGLFYPGTRYAAATGAVRVLVAGLPAGAPAQLLLATGGTVVAGGQTLHLRPGSTLTVQVQGDHYAVRSGKAHAEAAGSAIRVTSSAPIQVLATGRHYRGELRVEGSGAGLEVVDAVDVESYLLGLGEVRDPSWPAASLQALAVAARSYAVHAAGYGNPSFDLYDDDRSQVYLGSDAEYGALSSAVHATDGQVLTYGGSVIDAVYSASAGGVTATPAEGFGSGTGLSTLPYLAAAAHYPTLDPHAWVASFPAADVASRLGYAGRLTGLAITQRGPSGRALVVQLTGSAGSKDVSGVAMEAQLGLRSTLFDLGPPPAGTAVTTAITGADVGGTGAADPVAAPHAALAAGAARPGTPAVSITAPAPTQGASPSALAPATPAPATSAPATPAAPSATSPPSAPALPAEHPVPLTQAASVHQERRPATLVACLLVGAVGAAVLVQVLRRRRAR